MNRILVALATFVATLSLASFASSTHRAHAQELSYREDCLPESDRVTVTFYWTPSGDGPQWLDLSLADNGFRANTFVNAGPLEASQSSFAWEGLIPSATHFIRINTLTTAGWQPGPTYVFNTVDCHPPSSPPVVVQQRCSTTLPGRVAVTLSWTPGDAGPEWVDLSLFGNGFAPDTFLGAGPLSSAPPEFTWDRLLERSTHYLRVNTLTSAGWRPSATTAFVTIPCSAPVMANAPGPLRIPTYDGLGQAEHPDVVYFPAGWHGFTYWMAVTPYPNEDFRHENPSILVSNDGTTWQVPPGLTNPIVPAPACDHNSDPDLVYRPDTDQLYLYFTEQQRSAYCGALNQNYLRLMTSSDGVHWDSASTVMSWDLDQAPLYLSPAVVFRGGEFQAWMAGSGGVSRATSPDGINWSPLEPVRIDATPWHLDVGYLDVRSQYWMLFVDSPLAGSDLRLATSSDGIQWDVYPYPLLVPGAGWDNQRIYRSTFVFDEARGLRVWYSASNALGQWHVGYSETARGLP